MIKDVSDYLSCGLSEANIVYAINSFGVDYPCPLKRSDIKKLKYAGASDRLIRQMNAACE